MYIYIYIYLYTYIRIYIYIYTCTHVSAAVPQVRRLLDALLLHALPTGAPYDLVYT